MIYGKLPVTMLGAIASEKGGSTNSVIAAYLLEHLEAVRDMSITDLASVCHVSASSISRFCKETGFGGYAELREVLETSQMAYQQASGAATVSERAEETSRAIIRSIQMVKRSVNMKKVQRLCQEIASYPNVALFGLLKAEAAAIDLQCDLLMLGKQSYTNVSYSGQMEYILSAGRETLIVIFSCTGAYFEYQELREYQEALQEPRIWMITGEKRNYPDFIDETLVYASCHSQIGHPYQLQTVASLLAEEFARLSTC